MKNQIQNKLDFNKKSLVELNDQQMQNVDSGWTPALWIAGGALLALLHD